MQLNIIAAVAENRAIGYQNDMVYFIREDLKRLSDGDSSRSATC